MKLSILDQLTVPKNQSASDTLQEAKELAQLAEKLGYTRIWYAEHHGSDAFASATPEILVAHIASATEKIRVGAGGIMTMHYAPFKVAETFKTLAALYPDRIDLGMGRSPGGSPLTTLALNNGQPPQLDQFDKLPEILLFLREKFPEDHLYSKISAVPREVLLPQPWLLGASKESARSAGEYGINFSFAQFIHGHLPKEVLSAYYKHFRPVTEQQEPQVSAAYFTFAADTKEEAEYHAASFEHYIFATEHGLPNKFLSPEEALAFPYSEMDKLVLEQNKQRFVIGSSQEVAEFLHQQEELGLTEAMLITPGYDKQTRFQSFERLAKELL